MRRHPGCSGCSNSSSRLCWWQWPACCGVRALANNRVSSASSRVRVAAFLALISELSLTFALRCSLSFACSVFTQTLGTGACWRWPAAAAGSGRWPCMWWHPCYCCHPPSVRVLSTLFYTAEKKFRGESAGADGLIHQHTETHQHMTRSSVSSSSTSVKAPSARKRPAAAPATMPTAPRQAKRTRRTAIYIAGVCLPGLNHETLEA